MAISEEERAHLHELFDEFRRTGDPAIRDELATLQIGLAVHLARRFEDRGIPTDDLVQVASLALLKAIDRFEPERGLEFSTFATPTILGELKRHFRDRGWSVRVPRRVQELHVRINTIIDGLHQDLGRSPTIAEMAEAARCSEDEVLEALEASQAYRSGSLDTARTEDGVTLQERIGDDDDAPLRIENKMLVERLIDALPPREQLMIRMRFFEELTQSEIADRLGISQMHVSRLLSRCLGQFKEQLTSAGIVDDPTI